jgi:hypothetical protein
MAFNNLKSLKLQEITGSQLAQVGDIYADTSSVTDFREISSLKSAVINSKTFTGGLPFPDSIKIYSKSVSSDSANIKPSDIYPNDLDSDKYLVQLLGYAMTTNDATATASARLTDGSTDLPIFTNERAFDLDDLDAARLILINENNYITITEGGGYTMSFIGLYGIVSRGGV